MSNLALCYPDHVSAHLPASITSHAISHQNIDELIAARDKEALQLTNLIDAIEPNRQAFKCCFLMRSITLNTLNLTTCIPPQMKSLCRAASVKRNLT